MSEVPQTIKHQKKNIWKHVIFSPVTQANVKHYTMSIKNDNSEDKVMPNPALSPVKSAQWTRVCTVTASSGSYHWYSQSNSNVACTKHMQAKMTCCRNLPTQGSDPIPKLCPKKQVNFTNKKTNLCQDQPVRQAVKLERANLWYNVWNISSSMK